MRKLPLLIAVLLVLMLQLSCSREQKPPSAKPVRISSTAAYEEYFGPAPTVDKGTCYAFVIYFPSAIQPGKVVPFPFFTFDEGSMKKVAVERLISGMDVLSYRSEISQPFASGAHLIGLTEERGIVTADFSRDFLARSADKAGIVNAVVQTLSQFKGVSGIRIQSGGSELEFAKGIQKPSVVAVLEPSSPRLLGITGMKEKGANTVEEVDVLFDRPVDIKKLTLTDRGGAPIAGEMYHSVFDMAAVLKPKDPSSLKAGLPIRIHWQIVDKLGRQAEGDDLRLLELREH